MLDNVLKWINENRDNVTLGLAAFGSVLSVLNLFRDWRKKPEKRFSDDSEYFQFWA